MTKFVIDILLSLPPYSFLSDEYTVEVHINDYLDIICPHYAHGEVSSQAAERYVLYMVEKEDYDVCKPHSFDQLRWECSRPFAPHAPEKFSEKFQRFTPFTLGKEFRQGESYYYICKYQSLKSLVSCLLFSSIFYSYFCIKYVLFFGLVTAKPMHHRGQDCLRLKVDVIGHKSFGKTHQKKPKDEKKEEEKMDEGKGKFIVSGGVHPSNRLSAGENSSESLHSLVVPCLVGAWLGASAMLER